MERENKRIVRMAERTEDTDSRVHDLERDNARLVQQAGMDKKTLSTLREVRLVERCFQIKSALEIKHYGNPKSRKLFVYK